MIVEASLSIEVNVECPHCDHYFDLMEIESLTDEGYLLSYACPSEGHWSDKQRTFNHKEDCPECGKEIEIEGIGW